MVHAIGQVVATSRKGCSLSEPHEFRHSAAHHPALSSHCPFWHTWVSRLVVSHSRCLSCPLANVTHSVLSSYQCIQSPDCATLPTRHHTFSTHFSTHPPTYSGGGLGRLGRLGDARARCPLGHRGPPRPGGARPPLPLLGLMGRAVHHDQRMCCPRKHIHTTSRTSVPTDSTRPKCIPKECGIA